MIDSPGTSDTSTVPEAEPGPLIELVGVSRRYRMGDVTVTALETVDLQVNPGEFTVVLGPSGSGKTTLLNMIGALDSPTEGTVTLAEEDISRASRRRCSASAATRSASSSRPSTCSRRSPPWRTPSSAPTSAGRENPREAARETLERVGLGDRVEHFPHELSGGEQQRVAIARALATGNPVLLADEPTGELDFHTGVQILELLHEQTHQENTAILIVTHNREIARVAHRVVELSSGRVVSDAPDPGGPADISELHW